jgi:parallel beta-helix repeat protein
MKNIIKRDLNRIFYFVGLLSLLAISESGIIFAATEVGGTISSNTTWTVANSPYIISSDVTVDGGVTLTIDPGVVVKFDYGKELTIKGILSAVGTSEATIIFTSLKDDTYGGDTNGDGTLSSPTPGDWDCIKFYKETSASEARGTLKYCVVKYGGSSGRGNVWCDDGGSPAIQDSVISNSSNYAIFLDDSYPTYPSSNVFSDNAYDGVGLAGGSIYESGTLKNPGYPYIISSDVTVDGGVTLTIDPGVVVKFDYGKELTIKGILSAVGTSEATIIFTSLKDDTYGGDTNGDGTLSSPTPGDWDCIKFYKETSASEARGTLKYCVVKYGGGSGKGNIYCDDGGSPAIQDSVISNSSNYAIFLDDSYPTYPSSNVFSDNAYDGVGLAGGSIYESGTLKNPGYPYIISSDVTVDGGVTLTIDPGVVVKFDYGKELTIKGILSAVGTSEATIIFTSLKDDTYGGDTNGDGTLSSPTPGDWDCIKFYPYYGEGRGTLKYCIVKYGGSSGKGNIYCDDGGGPVIQYCSISNSKNAGIYIEDGSNPHLGDTTIPGYPGCNEFINNGTYAVVNLSSNDIKAENNWWGTVNEAVIQSLIYDYYDSSNYGKVDYIPWSTSPCIIPPQETHTLTVTSTSPSSGVSITVSPSDNSGQGSGTTPFTRTYDHDTVVTLTAPPTAVGNTFQKWQKDGVDYSTSQSISFNMDKSYTMTAVYLQSSVCSPPEDVNQDGKVNTSDLTPVIDAILGYGESSNCLDVNQDGKVSTSDLTPIIDYILGI